MTADAASPALVLEGVTVGYAEFTLEVEGLVLRRGEAVALHGPSGAGKSTLLDMLALARAPAAARRFEITPRSGAVIDVAALWRGRQDRMLTDARARHTGYVLQQGGLLPFLDVRGNIGVACAMLGRDAGEAIDRLAGALGIAALLARRPAALSVGERQRVAIARALVHSPDIVLADEPTASVHPAMADAVMTLLRGQAQAAGAALLLATHDPDRAARHGFRMIGLAPKPGRGTSSVLAA